MPPKNSFSFDTVSKSRSQQLPHVPLSGRVRELLCLCFCLIGLALIIFTDYIHEALPFILGIAMVITGVVFTIQGIRAKEHLVRETKHTANGILFFLLGVVIICSWRNADAFIGAIWGVFGLVKGSEDLNEAIYCYANEKPHISKFIRTAITLVLSVILLLDPASNVHHHLFILGLELLVTGFELLMDQKDEIAVEMENKAKEIHED